MKRLFRVLKNEKYGTLLLLLLFVLNSVVFLKVNAAVQWVNSSGNANFFSIVDTSLSPLKHSTIATGALPNIWNSSNNGLLSKRSVSVIYADCIDKLTKAECDPNYVNLKTLAAIDVPGFSTVDSLSEINATLLDQRPISAVDYFQDKVYALSHFGTVSAQTQDASIIDREAYYSPGGTGFSLLKPIQNFWSWSVRVVYGFLLLIVIVIAFAIMFRQRLSGNVEVTVQNAIPAIALAMILVPLSYAISGLFIDFLTVGSNAVHEFLIGAPGSPGNTLYLNSGTDANRDDPLSDKPFDDRGYYPDDVRVDWLRARDKINVSATFGNIANDVGHTSGLDGNVIFLAVGSIVNVLTGSDGDPANFTWVGDIVQFFLSIITLWIGIQIFVHLFKKYMTMILFPVISPFIFATIAIPGNGTKSIMQYVKVMAAAALAFIVTYAMFLLSIIFTSKEFLTDVPTFASASFNPPLIGLKSIGIGSNEMTQLLLTLIGLGIYFSIPSTLKSIDKAMGATETIPKFISTPIDSFNESRKVMFKTAPAIAARAAKSGVALTRNTVSLPTRSITAAADLRDRLRGKTPGEVGTYRYNQRQRLAGAYNDAKKKYEEAMANGNYGEAARLKASMAATSALGGMYGTGVGTPAELKDQEPKLNVKFTWKKNGAPENTIVFTKEEVLKYIAAGTVGGILDIGEMELEGENLKLPVNGTVDIGEMDSTKSTRAEEFKFGPLGFQLEGATIAGGVATLPPHPDIFGLSTIAPLPGANLYAVVDPTTSLKSISTLTPDSDNKKYKIKFALEVTNVAAFFGAAIASPAPGGAAAQVLISGGAISGAKDFKTRPRLFRITQNGAETKKPLSIVIKIQG